MRQHAVLLLDDHGRSVDFHIFTDDEHDLTHAICVGMALVGWLPHVRSVVLFSEVERIGDLAEDDARTWQQLVAAFDEQGVQLLDWIHTDAESVRSMTISCDAEPAWQRSDPDGSEP